MPRRWTQMPRTRNSQSSWWVGLAIAFIAVAAGTAFLSASRGGADATATSGKIYASWPVLYHDLGSLKQAADLAVLGTVTGTPSTTIDQGLPFTDFNVRVERVLHDSAHRLVGTSVTVHQTGGLFNGKQVEVEDDPLLRPGERVVVFLHEYRPGSYFIIGGPSGRFRVQNGVVTPINDEGVVCTSPPSEAEFLAQVARA